MFSNVSYTIVIWSYAEKHYISNFHKSYARARDITLETIYQELYRLDKFLTTSKAEIITSCAHGDIIKCEFAIAWSRMSPHASWYRYIVYHERKSSTLSILLVYGKDDVAKKQKETVRWQQQVKNNYDYIKTQFPSL